MVCVLGRLPQGVDADGSATWHWCGMFSGATMWSWGRRLPIERSDRCRVGLHSQHPDCVLCAVQKRCFSRNEQAVMQVRESDDTMALEAIKRANEIDLLVDTNGLY